MLEEPMRHWATNLVSTAPCLDQTLLRVLGCKERGHKSQGPLVHATGKGWVKEHKGQYYDALHVKNGIVKICLVESQGGIAPPTKRIIFNFAKEVGSPSAVDRTDYGTASGSARDFAQHQPLATAVSSLAPPSVAMRKTSTTLLATCVSRTHS